MAKAFAALIVGLCLAFSAAAAPPKSESKKPVRPAWSELTPAQQHVLAPLQLDWDSIDATRRKKWVEVAGRYPKMKPEEQQRLQKRMSEWAKLSPQERKEAREKYQTLQKLPPSKRQEVTTEWQRYQRSLAQQQQRQGAPLDPTLTDPADPAASAQVPGASEASASK